MGFVRVIPILSIYFFIYLFLINTVFINTTFINTAQANILFEPFAGYALKGLVKQKIIQGGTIYENEYTGIGYGLRLGYLISGLGFMGGFQGEMIKEDWTGKEPKVSGINDNKQKMEGTNYGVFLGYQSSFLFRFWGTYYFYDEYKKANDDGPYAKDDAYIGTAYSVGLGISLVRFMAINVEYRKFMLDRLFVKVDNKTYKLDSDRDVQKSEIFLSLSFPFDF
ncbi:MAG: hypothetical protein HQK49_20235 [Oligoflexia bacterium]|nr:hypothetical protein [Oligoflexia bacterium]